MLDRKLFKYKLIIVGIIILLMLLLSLYANAQNMCKDSFRAILIKGDTLTEHRCDLVVMSKPYYVKMVKLKIKNTELKDSIQSLTYEMMLYKAQYNSMRYALASMTGDSSFLEDSAVITSSSFESGVSASSDANTPKRGFFSRIFGSKQEEELSHIAEIDTLKN